MNQERNRQRDSAAFTERESSTVTPGISCLVKNQNSGEILGVDDGKLQQWYDWGSSLCRWEFQDAGNGCVRICSRRDHRCIEAPGASGNAEGAEAFLAVPQDGNRRQLWRAEPAGDGWHLRSAEGGEYLSVYGDRETDGSAITAEPEPVKSSFWTLTPSPASDDPIRPALPPRGDRVIRWTRTALIMDTDVELGFDRDVAYCRCPESYAFRLGSEETEPFPPARVISYFDRTVTLRLPQPITDPEHTVLTVQPADEAIRDGQDNTMDSGSVMKVVWDPYYTQEMRSRTGILVKACRRVNPAVLPYVCDVADKVFSSHPAAARAVAEAGAQIAIYPKGSHIYSLPENRELYCEEMLGIEGFGGDTENAVTSVGEGNIMRDPSATRYPDNNILAHELGHTLHLIGFARAEPELYRQIHETYERVRAAGLWPHTYLISNEAEYFAQLTALWFEGLDESPDGTFNGVLAPVNTREELEEYDPDSWKLMSRIYPGDVYFLPPWSREDAKDHFDIHGNPRE